MDEAGHVLKLLSSFQIQPIPINLGELGKIEKQSFAPKMMAQHTCTLFLRYNPDPIGLLMAAQPKPLNVPISKADNTVISNTASAAEPSMRRKQPSP